MQTMIFLHAIVGAILSAQRVEVSLSGFDDKDFPKALNEISVIAVEWNKLKREHIDNREFFSEPNGNRPFEGWVKTTYPNGNIKLLFNVKTGIRNGPCFSWYESGQKQSHCLYREGKSHGETNYWYENGQQFFKHNYNHGELEGRSEIWYFNGQLQCLSENINGQLISTEVWKIDGKKCSTTNFKGGDGIIAFYNFRTGVEHARENFQNGVRHGPTTIWYENGNKKSVRNYKRGQQDGLSIFYNENGSVKEQVVYKDGKRVEN